MMTTRKPARRWLEGQLRPGFTVCHRPPAILSYLPLLIPFFVVAGCTDRGENQEAADAKVMVQKLKFNLTQATNEMATLKAELNAVRQSRDELQEKVAQLIEERDQSLVATQQAQEMVTRLTSRADGQVSATAALERQIGELKARVEEQKEIIEQLQKSTPTEPAAATTPAPTTGEQVPPPTEPNQGA